MLLFGSLNAHNTFSWGADPGLLHPLPPPDRAPTLCFERNLIETDYDHEVLVSGLAHPCVPWTPVNYSIIFKTLINLFIIYDSF